VAAVLQFGAELVEFSQSFFDAEGQAAANMCLQRIDGRQQQRLQAVAVDAGSGDLGLASCQLFACFACRQRLPLRAVAQLGLLRIQASQRGALLFAQQVQFGIELFDLTAKADQALRQGVGFGLRLGGLRFAPGRTHRPARPAAETALQSWAEGTRETSDTPERKAVGELLPSLGAATAHKV